MAGKRVVLLKKVGADISGPGRLDRDAILLSFAIGSKDRLVSALRQVAAAGERASELLLVSPVAKLMGHQEPEVCAAAVAAMGSMGAAAFRFAEDIAEFVLKHPDAKCRCAALEALGKMGPGLPGNIRQAIAACLSDGEASVRQSAVQALSEIHATGHIKAIKALLEDRAPIVRGAAIEGIGYLISVSEEVESQCPQDFMDKYISDLLPNGRTRHQALMAVSYMADQAPPGCACAVVDALTDKDSSTRQVATSAVGAMAKAVAQNSEAMRNLESLLKNSEAGVRAAAAHALGAMGEEASGLAGPVAELLADAAEDISALAATAGTAARRPPAQLRLPRCAALTALGRMRAAQHVDAVASALADASWEVRAEACAALGRLGEAAKGEVDALIGMLEDDAYPVRAAACSALGDIGHAEALASLIEKFEDKAHAVRICAVAAIGKLGSDAAEYSHDVFKLLNDPVPQVQAAAAACLPKLGESGLCYAGVLGTMLYEAEPEVRCAAAEALGAMGDHGAALYDDIAIRAQSDPSAAVRQAAAAALATLGAVGKGPAALQDEGAGYQDYGYMGSARALVEERPRFEGLGLYYAEIQEKKKELQSSGKWIEGIF